MPRFKVDTDPIKMIVSGFEHHLFAVVDDEARQITAYCPSIGHASQVAHALNFNARPYDYGYVLERLDNA